MLMRKYVPISFISPWKLYYFRHKYSTNYYIIFSVINLFYKKKDKT